MTDTPKLSLPEISVSQTAKYATHNTALRFLDCLVQATVIDKDLSTPPVTGDDGDTYIVGPSATGSWTGHDGDIAYYYPTIFGFPSPYEFHTPAEGWRVYVADENAFYVYSGSAWVHDQPYDVRISHVAAPGNSEVLHRMPMTRSVSFPSAFIGSQASAGTAATAEAVFDLQKNGSSIGTATFAAAGTTATFAGAGGSFAAGDVLAVVAPASADASLAEIGFTLLGLLGS